MRIHLLSVGFLAVIHVASANDFRPTAPQEIAARCMGPLNVAREENPRMQSRLILMALGQFSAPQIEGCRRGLLPPEALSQASAERLGDVVNWNPSRGHTFPRDFGSTLLGSNTFLKQCRQIPVVCRAVDTEATCSVLPSVAATYRETGRQYAQFIQELLRDPMTEGHRNYTAAILAVGQRFREQSSLAGCETGEWGEGASEASSSDATRAPPPAENPNVIYRNPERGLPGLYGQ